MNNIYRITLLLGIFLLFSTYTPKDSKFKNKKVYDFFKIKEISISNTKIINENDILEKLKDVYGKNIIFIKKDSIKEPLSSVDFLEKIEVKKKYPNTIILKIFETKPIGIIFKNEKKYFLDNISKLIIFDENLTTKNLPTIFGEDAETNFLKFSELLKKNKFPNTEIKNYYFYQIGRWDLQLLDDKIIKFPETNVQKAILKSIELINREDFKKYKIIDLRLHDKIIVE